MPRKTSSYWTSMDFGSEEEDVVTSKSPSSRVYVDPWDLENYAFMRRHLEETPVPSTPQSPAGEPASSNFYYISNNYDHHKDVRNTGSLQRTLLSADSPTLFAGIDELDFHNENFEIPYDVNRGVYYHQPYDDFMQDRKLIVPRPTLTDTGSSLSSGNENYVYTTTDVCDPTSPDASLVYVYETTTRKRKIALPKSSRRLSSNGKPAVRKFRLLENGGYYDNYEDMHMVPSIPIKPPPENFGLSPYGHLKIDYSCSWHSLDKLIRSE
ncbi:uncharacterized protein LOC143923231 isoform X2 [Arctopsyche grandis]|uniref:uncharacterized protein LOC143923231 isoform X2 n=1 Tax=Arctopsyche grandis TaxID=121162 RepID=UPI00406D76C5